MKRFATATILCCVHQIYGFFVPQTRLQSIGSTRTTHQMTKNDSVSVQKARQLLEEGYRKQIFGRKPLKLDYRTSRRWIQKNWAPKSKEEFYDLVANGNLRTPYISKQPEQYYGDRGEWISWDHYLLGTDEEDDENGIFEHRVTKWG